MTEPSESKSRLPRERPKLGIAYMVVGALLMVVGAFSICGFFFGPPGTPDEALLWAGFTLFLGGLLLLLHGRRHRVREGRLLGQRPNLGIAYMVVGPLVMAAGMILMLYLFFLKGEMLFWAIIQGLIAAAPGAWLLERGGRHRIRVGHPADDSRKPILFLRPFKQDGLRLPTPDFAAKRMTRKEVWAVCKTDRGGVSYENMIRHAFRKMGPLLAIGKPGEKLPKRGAARVYFSRSDEQGWKQKVGELLADSQLVLLQVGGSPGLAWEVEHAVDTLAGTPTRLVLCIPTPRLRHFGISSRKLRERKRKRMYQAFRELHGSKFPKGLPEDIGCRQFICFDQDWTPHPPEWYGDPLPGEPDRQVTEALNWLSARLG